MVSLLPVGTPAFRLNLFAAFFMLASLWLLLDVCRKLENTLSEILLMLMGIFFLFNRSVFAEALTAKGCVYALSLLVLSGLLWLSMKSFAPKAFISLGWFIWSVGMGNHWQTEILLIPFLCLWAYQSNERLDPKKIFILLSWILLGLSLYLYLPLRTSSGVLPCWGNPVSPRGFYWVVSRQLVRGSENWIQPLSFYAHSAQWELKSLAFYWAPGFGFVALLGAVMLWRKDRALFLRFLFFCVPLVTAVLLVHEERNQYLVPVYLISAAGITLVFGFLGIQWIVGRSNSPQGRTLAFVLLFIVGTGWGFYVFQNENKNGYLLEEDFGINVLKAIPQDGLLLADGDPYVMSIWYQKYARGLRPDIVFEPSIFLYHDWGWRQLTAQSPDLREAIDSSNLFVGRVVALTELSRKHPFFNSLGREYLAPVLKEVPGHWVPKGLIYEWRQGIPPHEKLKGNFDFVSRMERYRGLSMEPNLSMLDESSRQIYGYYALQHSVMADFLKKSPGQFFNRKIMGF